MIRIVLMSYVLYIFFIASLQNHRQKCFFLVFGYIVKHKDHQDLVGFGLLASLKSGAIRN